MTVDPDFPAGPDEFHLAISRAIHSRRHEISAVIVESHYALRPELRDRYGEQGREKCIEDTEQHLAHLSAALLVSSPSLFADYIRWAGSVMSSAGIRPEDVLENLASFRDGLAPQLPEGMVAVAASYVESAMAGLTEPRASMSGHPPDGDPLDGIAGDYLRLLLACRRHDAAGLILDAVESGMSIRDVYLRVFQPCQRELGRLWETGRITVAQEHYCTAATQMIMSRLAPRLFSTEKNGHRAVIACVADEAHEVGTRMVADLMELAGWDTFYLGGSVPTRGVVQALIDHRADMLAASATMTSHLPALIDLIAAVRAEPACAGVKVIVGGRPFHSEPELWRRVGADGQAADADEACRLAERLVGEPPGGSARVVPRAMEMGREVVPAPSPAPRPEDLYDELGRVNSEVVALNRELSRKNAEVGRLHAEVSRQALDLAAADRRKNEFLALLGHELRNPLAPLRNALALLGPEDPDPETVRWARGLMGRQVGQMVRLVDDLFDLSRIMQGKLDLRKERIELATVVADAVETARPVVEAKGHELIVSLPAGPMPLDADPIRLSQALTNLLNNAAKYSEPGGRIVLSARREGPDLVIGVRDDGVGIAPEMLPRIFDLFVQEGRSADQSQGGLGVGLALVKSLVELHGGGVQARSEGPGLGSEFLVRIPALAKEAASGAKGDRKPIEARWPRHRILVVDDNEDAANALGRLLRRSYNQEVEVAHDGPSALAAAAAFRPEMVLLDIGLPGMDGNEVARRLRGTPGFEAVTLLAVTGWGHEEDRRRSLEAGFDHHLVKPVDPEAILDLLTQARDVAR
jgi:signal transduction histidine kinase/ActR/RegA family two-component response regulator